MNFPTLPTDNLYKFLALSGVVVVLVSIFYPMSRLGEFQQREIEVTAEMGILDLENKRLTVIQSRLEKDLATLEKQVSASERRKRPTPRNVDSMKKTIDELTKSNDELQVNLVKVGAKIAQLAQLATDIKYFVIVMFGGIVVGFLLASVGFVLWYIRVQRPQDLLLKQQIENKAT